MTIPPLKNDLLLRALHRQPVPRTPVWMMRQAGRYLPEYRASREKAGDFIKLMSTPELACEVTLQPLARFRVDAAILFSDILTIPDAMGLGLQFVAGEGPRFERPVRGRKDIENIGRPDPETDLRYVMDAVRLIRHELAGSVPLIGFAGSPWTLATYMVEGESSRTFSRILSMAESDPAALHLLLEKLSDSVSDYLTAQICAGAQAIMIFDTWGGALDETGYSNFSLQYMTRIIQNLTRKSLEQPVPIILFTKGGGAWLEQQAATGCDAIGLDWSVNIGNARARVGSQAALQGNMDPDLLRESPETIRSSVEKILSDFGKGNGHVFNLGHGIKPDIDPEHANAMIEAVHEFSPRYHD